MPTRKKRKNIYIPLYGIIVRWDPAVAPKVKDQSFRNSEPLLTSKEWVRIFKFLVQWKPSFLSPQKPNVNFVHYYTGCNPQLASGYFLLKQASARPPLPSFRFGPGAPASAVIYFRRCRGRSLQNYSIIVVGSVSYLEMALHSIL